MASLLVLRISKVIVTWNLFSTRSSVLHGMYYLNKGVAGLVLLYSTIHHCMPIPTLK
jgi:hypothetical protein